MKLNQPLRYITAVGDTPPNAPPPPPTKPCPPAVTTYTKKLNFGFLFFWATVIATWYSLTKKMKWNPIGAFLIGLLAGLVGILIWAKFFTDERNPLGLFGEGLFIIPFHPIITETHFPPICAPGLTN